MKVKIKYNAYFNRARRVKVRLLTHRYFSPSHKEWLKKFPSIKGYIYVPKEDGTIDLDHIITGKTIHTIDKVPDTDWPLGEPDA